MEYSFHIFKNLQYSFLLYYYILKNHQRINSVDTQLVIVCVRNDLMLFSRGWYAGTLHIHRILKYLKMYLFKPILCLLQMSQLHHNILDMEAK